MSRTLVISAIICAAALTLSIQHSSLWADEAFSAWLASHQSLSSFGWSLFHGDSSDLQMGAYYLYLFGWVKAFGASEYALRAANIPFILIFSFSIVWISSVIFRSRVAWVAPALLPFVWHYASEARPYMAILALSTAALASLLGFIHLPAPANKNLPWICLTSVFLGSCFHMLALLPVPPLLLLAWSNRLKWREWIPAFRVFAVPFLALAAFIVFTFMRGTAYDYPSPGLRQMASVVYELSGLSGFGPNRKFALDFRPYLVPVTLAAVALVMASVCAWIATRKLLPGLGAAVGLAIAEAIVLSVILQKQIDVRHLAALIPLLFILLMAAMERPSASAVTAMLLFAGVWLAADIRLALLPEYQKEDYRDAVAKAISLQKQSGGAIALAADPVAAAYYGMRIIGDAPCFPIRQNCAEAFARAGWDRGPDALDAEQWPASRIDSWLQLQHDDVVFFGQLDRRHQNSAWWPVVKSNGATVTAVHGFDIDVLRRGDLSGRSGRP